MQNSTQHVGHLFDSYQQAKLERMRPVTTPAMDAEDSKRIKVMLAVAIGLVLASLLCSAAVAQPAGASAVTPAVKAAPGIHGVRAITLVLMVPFAGMLVVARRRGQLGGMMMTIGVVTVALSLGNLMAESNMGKKHLKAVQASSRLQDSKGFALIIQ